MKSKHGYADGEPVNEPSLHNRIKSGRKQIADVINRLATMWLGSERVASYVGSRKRGKETTSRHTREGHRWPSGHVTVALNAGERATRAKAPARALASIVAGGSPRRNRPTRAGAPGFQASRCPMSERRAHKNGTWRSCR